MSESATIRFLLDGKVVEICDVDPTRTVLQFLDAEAAVPIDPRSEFGRLLPKKVFS